MNKLLLIDGNSIINRAFYGIMGNKMLMTVDGTYTNAVYGFLSILFKILDDLQPNYMAIAFDLKAPTYRHKLYSEYKGTRKGMPDELANQMPILKNILKEMNIRIIEKEGYEADDIIGTMSKLGEESDLEVTILSGDRDTFQLVSEKTTVRIPRTKAGKTETEDFTPEKIKEVYGLEPVKLIEVKGLMGDTSDNIPGIPGVGEKTALRLVKEYGTIENLYKAIENSEDDLKGALRNKVITNKEQALLSKTLGTIDRNATLDVSVEDTKIKEWNKNEVLNIFKELKFNRFIDRFELESTEKILDIEKMFNIQKLSNDLEEGLCKEIKDNKKIYYYFRTIEDNKVENIIKKRISGISIYSEKNNTVYEISIDTADSFPAKLKNVFEDESIKKISYGLKEDYILLKQVEILMKNVHFDIKIAAYLLNSTYSQYKIADIAEMYLNLNFDSYINKFGGKNEQQISLFGENTEEKEQINYEDNLKAYVICKLYSKLKKELENIENLELFNNIEMPLIEILANMQYEGIYINKNELINYGNELQEKIKEKENQIYELCDTEFNINSPKQLGEVLFEKLKLPVYKKNKSGYATDVDTLNKLKKDHPVIEIILEYRQISKLKSTFVEGIVPYINEKTHRIHSCFHQTVTATGRISSTEPNMQNIPTRMDAGKTLRKVFKPKEGYVFLDADYSQIELRVFAHISQDESLIEAFQNGEDIHKQAASKVFNVQIEEVTPELRSKAKAVNFGIVYGISDFGLAEQIGTSKKQAKEYIQQYLEKYHGIRNFMEKIPEMAKEKGYVETIFKRRRYIPELSSNNYMIRQFGARAAMNTPIQGTAADIIKLAMINVCKEINNHNIDAKLVLQIHDELLIEVNQKDKEEMKNILKNCMENVIKLSVPLKADVNEGNNWYEVK